MVTYTSREVCKLAGCSYRQLDYWCRIGLLQSSAHEANGSGSRRLFEPADVQLAKRIRIASDLINMPLIDALDRLDEILAEVAEDPELLATA